MSRRKLNKKQDTLSNFLPGLIREKGWEVQIDLHSIFPDWRDIVGELADHATPEKIVKNVLFVQVENSAWIQQFQYQKMELLDMLNAHLRLSRLSDIKFKSAPQARKRNEEEHGGVRFEPPSKQEQDAFQQQIDFIEDEKTKESLMRIWYLSNACRRD